MSTTPNTPAPSANLPAQVTLAPQHVTDSYGEALARARAARYHRPEPAMSDDLGHACAELAALIPALIPALSRDSVPSGGRTALSAGGAVNPDVLHAMIILAVEIPAACAAACEVTSEPWQHRPSAICLRTIPRLHHRLTALGMPATARDLETGVHQWTRMVKLALGLRTPESPSAGTKPLIAGGPPQDHHLMPPTRPREPALGPVPPAQAVLISAPAGRTRPRHRRRGLRA